MAQYRRPQAAASQRSCNRVLVHVGMFSLRVVLLVSLVLSAHAADPPPVVLLAHDAYESGTELRGLRYDPVRKGVILYDRVLIEDDGPGIATDAKMTNPDDRSPLQELSDVQRIKKVLHVERPEALEARLYVPLGVRVEVNGTLLSEVVPIDFWTDDADYPLVPPGLLKSGDNEIVVYKPVGKVGVKTAYRKFILQNAPERKDWPKRSYLSTDSGKTWNQIDDEYMIRLQLRQHVPQGLLVSPVIDMGDSAQVIKGTLAIGSLTISADADVSPQTKLEFQVRYGTTVVYDQSTWSAWSAVDSAIPAAHRYLQWQATFATADGRVTPVLRQVTTTLKQVVEQVPTWAARVTVDQLSNDDLRYTSLPFEYEDPFHPKCIALRAKYSLDKVIASGTTELEKFTLLRNWVAKQWRFKPPVQDYPSWDADEILTRKIGFCSQYAIVFMQCAASLGYTARYTFGFHPGTIKAGHEINEIWSNELRKWILVDANNDEINVDPQTGSPLSMIEVHDRMTKLCYGDKIALYDARPKSPRFAPDIQIVHGTDTTPFPGQSASETAKGWPHWMKWLYVHYVPRNNFYTHQFPVPKVQGMTFDYADHYVWVDEQTPMPLHYRHYISRRADLYWTLNQVKYDVSYAESGTLRIQMGTVTPNFATYCVSIDGSPWIDTARTYIWKLNPGANRIEVRTRNTAGILGPPSSLAVTWQ